MAASSSSKPTAVHFSLVFFVLLSIVMGLLYYVANNDAAKQREAAARATADARASQTQGENDARAIEAMKAILFGANDKPAEFGNPESADPGAGTVVGKINSEHFAKYDPTLAERSHTALLASMEKKLVEMKQQLDKRAADLADLQGKYDLLDKQYTDRNVEEKNARTKSEQDLAAAIASKDEEVKKKDEDITALRTAINSAQLELEEEKQKNSKIITSLNRTITDLSTTNDTLNDKLNSVTRQSFEVPDGRVDYVDVGSRTVWINLGEADKLQPRTTFSVYKQSNSGVGRGKEDIKAQLEVVRINGAHAAECRITEEDIYNPISSGDPIYTPLWSPGQSLIFSFVGPIDLDGDGKEDPEALRELLVNVGAKIGSYTDENGEIRGEKVTEDNPSGISTVTKFLILGTMPEYSSTSVVEEQNRIKRMLDSLDIMRKSARSSGVRPISVADFLAYIGYKNQRRLFTPGSGSPYTLKSGARSGAVNETLGNRSSTGNTNDAYDPSKRNLKPKTSTSTLNKLFRGN